MDASCSKDVSSNSKFSKTFTESNESVSEANSNFYRSDDSDISRYLSSQMNTQNQNIEDQWIHPSGRFSC